jgi:N-glycosylase/DNA lyase
MQELISEFTKRESKIRDWLASVRTKWQSRDDVLFELLFCLCTPQSKAPVCRAAINKLKERNLSDSVESKHLTGVRFPNVKVRYIGEAQKKFHEIYQKIQALHSQPLELREWLVKNVRGYGYKEASHFLRNIGLGKQLAILDVHILRELEKIGLLEKGAKLSPRKYLSIECKFVELAHNLKLKPAELDIAIWLARSGNEEIM